MVKENFTSIVIFLLICLFVQPLAAQEETEATVESSRELVLQISSLPEAKLGFTQHFTFPFLQGESFLTKDNNIKLALTAEVSPVSFNGIAEIILTPVAFLEFQVGGRIGSGWNIKLLGKEVYGIGLSRADGAGYKEHSGSAFDGMLWMAKAGGAFQFDLAALFPGDWNHVVFRTYHEINYTGYTRAKTHESWYFESGHGEWINGFNYFGSYILGYQMPIFLNMAAFMAESDLFINNMPNRRSWGDDLIRWKFSLALNFEVPKLFDIMLITQFRTMRNFYESNWNDLYYRNRTLKTSDPLRLEFFRVALVVTYRL